VYRDKWFKNTKTSGTLNHKQNSIEVTTHKKESEKARISSDCKTQQRTKEEIKKTLDED
jgi:hypothetical protein